MARGAGVNVEINANSMAFMNGVIMGTAESMSDKATSASFIKYVHANLNTRFETWMDAMALAHPSNLTHVYEWGQLGKPTGHLWESVLRGRGNDRTASIIWKASRKAVPVDPRLLIPGSTGKTVKEGVHIFYWKAPVMEAGLEITVEPKLSPVMTFVNSSGELTFQKEPVTFEAGGGKTTGQFTKHYYAYWTGMAQNVYNNQIAPEIEATVSRTIKRIKPRKATKASIGSGSSEFRRGRNLGMLGLNKVKRNYEAAARARRAFLYGE
jgi:hypothetical protein